MTNMSREVREPTPGAVTNAVVAGVGAYAVSKMVECVNFV